MHYTLKDGDKDKAEGTQSALQQKLLESRSIVISGEINQALAEKVITQDRCSRFAAGSAG